MKKSYTLTLLLAFLISFGSQAQREALWYTSMGDFKTVLFTDSIPITTQNFISLVDAKYYDNTIFHRVIDDFMNQGGDPTGTGSGGPGWTIPDEFHPDFRHDTAGILSMANAGPNTGGSQFFITVVPTPWLDDAHSVFGKVTEGFTIVNNINEVPTNAQDRPLTDVVLDSIRMVPNDPPTSIAENGAQLKTRTFPNPSRGAVNFEIELDQSGDVSLQIFRSNGQLVHQINKTSQTKGTVRITWNRESQSGFPIAPGAYLYQWITPNQSVSGPLFLTQ